MQLMKWIAAGAMGVLMAGSTLAFATLADFPEPFITADNGIGDTLVVVGSQGDWPAGLASDVAGAVDIAARLGSENSESYTCAGSSGGSVVSGEGQALATTNKKLYIQDVPRKTGVRYTMTSEDLPVTLKSGLVEDSDASTSHTYDQYIEFSDDYNITLAQARPDTSAAQDPAIVVKNKAGTNPANPAATDYFYKTKVVFQKNLNITTGAGESIELFGKSYTISSSSTFSTAGSEKLVLYGSADTRVLTEGDEVSVTVGGTAYTVKLNGVSDADTVVIAVGSETKSMDKAQTRTIGGLQVYVDDVYYYGSTRTDNQAKVSLGAETVTLEQNKKVTTGSGTTTNIDGTHVNITASNFELSALEVLVVPTDSVVDAMAVGQEFTDPVFDTVRVAFPSVTPGLMDASRNVLTVQASGDDALTFTYTNDKNVEATVTWAYDADKIDITDSADYKIVVTEGANINQNDYVVLDAGDYTHILQLTDLDNDGTTTGDVEFTDLFSGTKYEFVLGQDGQADAYIDGQLYKINGEGNVTYVNITWGDGAGFFDVGDEVTVYPRLEGKNGEFLAITNYTTVNIKNEPSLILPTGTVTVTLAGNDTAANNITLAAATGYSVASSKVLNPLTANHTELQVGKTSSGRTYYNITKVNNDTLGIRVLGSDTTPASAGNSTGLLLVEEEEGANNNVHTIFIPAGEELSGSTHQIIAGSPEMSSPYAPSAALKTDTYMTRYVDLYGTMAEKNTYSQDRVVVYYPDQQMTADLFVLGPGGSISTAAAVAGATVSRALPYKTALAKVDTDVTQTDKETKNLILVGGPIVNSLVAELADAGKTKATAWYADQAEGSAIIDLVEDAWAAGANALVVAGKDAVGTKAATAVIQKYDDYASDLVGSGVVVKGTVITSQLS